MIKSKLDARERAVELAAPIAIEMMKGGMIVNLESLAQELADFIIGNAELPEVVDDNDHIKTLIAMIETEMAAFRKQGNDNLDSLTSFLEKREMALSGIPCKSSSND